MSMSPKTYNRESTVNDMRLCLNNLLTQSDHHRHRNNHNHHHHYYRHHKTQDIVNDC